MSERISTPQTREHGPPPGEEHPFWVALDGLARLVLDPIVEAAHRSPALRRIGQYVADHTVAYAQELAGAGLISPVRTGDEPRALADYSTQDVVEYMTALTRAAAARRED